MITREERRERARRRVRRERRIAAVVVCGCIAAVAAVFMLSQGDSSVDARSAAPPKPLPPQEPRGGRTLLPRYRIVAYYGAPHAPELGQLGIGSPADAVAGLVNQARPYARPNRPVMPALELIATLATAAPGTDGKYRYRQSDHVIDRYLDEARRARALLILDIQPGRSPFMNEVRSFAPYLRLPDVSLALDPEWSMHGNELPGKVIGSTDAAVVNQAAAYLSSIVHRYNLPQKLLIVHQFTAGMIRHKHHLQEHAGVALVINVDGFGTPPNKISKYDLFSRHTPPPYNGFKLFYHEDTHMMRPRAVLRLRPPPDVIEYE